jgi:hypothetical protein
MFQPPVFRLRVALIAPAQSHPPTPSGVDNNIERVHLAGLIRGRQTQSKVLRDNSVGTRAMFTIFTETACRACVAAPPQAILLQEVHHGLGATCQHTNIYPSKWYDIADGMSAQDRFPFRRVTKLLAADLWRPLFELDYKATCAPVHAFQHSWSPEEIGYGRCLVVAQRWCLSRH